jgi:stress response protein SCP2
MQKHSGKHTINIALDQLPPKVSSLWFTITAYTTTLKDIKQPYIRFTDADSSQELCRYDLEQNATGNNTAVIMCKLHRDSAKGNWNVLAIGHIGSGRASNYEPIKTNIGKLWK